MKSKVKKTILYTVLAFILVLVIAAVCYFQFTADGYRMTVPYRSSFEEIAENVYINRDYAVSREDTIRLTDEAKERVEEFFGDLRCLDDTVFIFFDDDRSLQKLGGEKETYTVFFPSVKNYIMISNEHLNLDILSHELTHAEMHIRLSESALKKLPSWFDEGIAVQNDYREQYSLEQWIEQTDNGNHTIALEDMDEPSEFYAGTSEEKCFRYINAKHEVGEWMETHKQQGLLELIDELNNGEEFSTAYDK